MNEKKRFKKNKFLLGLLFLIFILPVLISSIFYYYPNAFSFHTNNKGIFIRPPILLKNNSIKKWQVIYITPDKCDQRCESIFHNLNQVRLALGKNRERVSVSAQPLNKLNKMIPLLKIHQIYLVDPIGNLFMYYPEKSNPLDILSDLKHLLEISQIG